MELFFWYLKKRVFENVIKIKRDPIKLCPKYGTYHNPYDSCC